MFLRARLCVRLSKIWYCHSKISIFNTKISLSFKSALIPVETYKTTFVICTKHHHHTHTSQLLINMSLIIIPYHFITSLIRHKISGSNNISICVYVHFVQKQKPIKHIRSTYYTFYLQNIDFISQQGKARQHYCSLFRLYHHAIVEKCLA